MPLLLLGTKSTSEKATMGNSSCIISQIDNQAYDLFFARFGLFKGFLVATREIYWAAKTGIGFGNTGKS